LPAPTPQALDFRALFDEQVDFVWRVLRRYGVPDRDVDDLCQEVFLIVHRKLAEFEGRSSVRTWIYGIAARTAIAARRKAYVRRESLEPTMYEPGVEATQSEQADQRRELSLVESVLATMDSEKREAFVLYELEGLSVAEVAHAVGVPENTALYRLHRAREELERRLRQAALVASVRAVRPVAAGGRGA
jgi:RNA polymerase sigma-70 factor (ECF subfamily)